MEKSKLTWEDFKAWCEENYPQISFKPLEPGQKKLTFKDIFPDMYWYNHSTIKGFCKDCYWRSPKPDEEGLYWCGEAVDCPVPDEGYCWCWEDKETYGGDI